MSSGYAIVAGDTSLHRAAVLGLARSLPEFPESRYERYYDANPLGPPVFRLAADISSGHIVGMASLHRLRVSAAGELLEGGLAADFVIDESHRGFGPALTLQRELVAALPDAGLSFVLALPNTAAEPVFRRLGYQELGRFNRFVKVLRASFAVRHSIGRPGLARAASIADPLLAYVSRERRLRKLAKYEVVRPDRFDARLTGVLGGADAGNIVIPARDAAVLNWKYELGGETRYSIFAVAKDPSAVAAYAVYARLDNVWHLFDLLAQDPDALDALLTLLLLDARSDGADAVALSCLGQPLTLATRLRYFGFFRRADRLGAFIYTLPHLSEASLLREGRNWYLLSGDSDL